MRHPDRGERRNIGPPRREVHLDTAQAAAAPHRPAAVALVEGELDAEALRGVGERVIGTLHVDVARANGTPEERPRRAPGDDPHGGVEARGDGVEHGGEARGERSALTYTPASVAERFYITTPIYYVNAEPHVGHAYTTIMADMFARHHRQLGEDVFFLTGTDEHGTKIARAAEAAGRDPQTHADILSARFRDLAATVGASNDFFIRTTDPDHKRQVQAICDRLHANGHIYRGSYSGWYCVACELFYPESELGAEHACPIHGTPAEWTDEENWFFRLSAYRGRLLEHYDAHPSWVAPTPRFNEARSMIAMGLEDLSISRSRITWGVPLSWDPDQVLYVWVDALFNYWTALHYPCEDRVAFWPPSVQLIAKDILKFHAVIWPALLMAAELPLPERLFIHGYVLKGGEKMSKTSGNVVDPFPFIERYGIDALRYYLAREVRFGDDGTFTQEGFEQRYDSELANEFGNLLNRTVSMIGRYRDGRVPHDPGGDDPLTAAISATADGVRSAFSELAITRAIDVAWREVRRLNRFVEQRAPWKLAKDAERAGELDQTLFSLAEGLRVVAILLWPVMPTACERALAQLGQCVDGIPMLSGASRGAGVDGARVGEATPLFPRVDPDPE
ncbi:MAG: methionine--tRNA ligase [Actinobacteria bacterium]|nr:methionine--tRNA ligase [Actinomycetota bacterium]